MTEEQKKELNKFVYNISCSNYECELLEKDLTNLVDEFIEQAKEESYNIGYDTGYNMAVEDYMINQ